MQLQRAGTAKDHLLQRFRLGCVTLAGETDVHRNGIERLDHPPDVPWAWRASRRQSSMRRPRTAAKHGRHARHQRFFDLLRADEMDMRVHAAGREDLAFASNDLRTGADDDRNAGLRIGVAGLTDGDNQPVLQAHIGLVDTGMIDDHRIGDDRVDGSVCARNLALAHAVAYDLAAAEFHLLAIDGEIPLDLNEELGIGQAHLVTSRRAEHARIGGAGNFSGHGISLLGEW